MEVVALKFAKKKVFVLVFLASLALLLVGVGLLVAYALISTWDADAVSYFAVALIVIGVAVTGLSLFGLIRYSRMPSELISYEEGVFTLYNGAKIAASEVTEVKFDSSFLGFGSVTVVAGGKKYRVNYIGDTSAVYDKMLKIITDSRKA